jgi:hypothetical protein
MPFWLKKKVKGDDADDKDDDGDGKGKPFGGKQAKPFGKGGKK